MSLVTSCPACHTAFRVVQDQLKVSQGWVRCGQCHEVFNALESLSDQSTPSARTALRRPTDGRAAGSGRRAPPEAASPDSDEDESDSHLPSRFVQAAHAPGRRPAPPPSPATAQRGPPPAAPASAPSPAPDSAPSEGLDTDALAAPFDASLFHDSGQSFTPGKRRKATRPAVPQFVQQAERAERWRHPAMRSVLGTASGLLLLLLGAQIAIFQRDLLAARWPELRPLLQLACRPLQCQVGSPRLIHEIVLDSSNLSATREANVLRLEADLRNSASVPVRLPALELSLTGDQGQLLSRRVLLSAELGADSDALAAEKTRHLSVRLDVGALKVAGYTLEVFYP